MQINAPRYHAVQNGQVLTIG